MPCFHARTSGGLVCFTGWIIGAAGVWWALWALQRAGAVVLRTDPVAETRNAVLPHRAAPDIGQVERGLYSGAAGVLLVQWRLGAETAGEATAAADAAGAAAEHLYAVASAHIDHPSNEPFLGEPGTLLAAGHRATREPRWRDLCLRHVDVLWARWHFDDAAQCHLWTQDFGGQRAQ